MTVSYYNQYSDPDNQSFKVYHDNGDIEGPYAAVPGNPDFTHFVRQNNGKPAEADQPIIPFVAPPKEGSDVNDERDRRILAGTVITVTGYGNIPVTGTKDDKDVFLARRMIAAEVAANGVTTPVFVFRDRENAIHNLTPSQMVELADKGFSWIEAMMVRSWEMKDGTGAYAYVDEENAGGIPDDLDNDSHWPTPA
ncbi:hypothetical protein [Labrenzia sp. R5_0]|uniref:DUF4376 domain-containing protein n=1 Tax=Labrenzia sp. R5_0 TaxID=2821108 RepID=UPI001ADD33B3|nr:hypothetical protein [Labrenzia sp. R5_0]MBO9458978.1 hypothetical protein [Labrenzia sp. R5_0]